MSPQESQNIQSLVIGQAFFEYSLLRLSNIIVTPEPLPTQHEQAAAFTNWISWTKLLPPPGQK
jgi:hypothetical protein